MIKKLCGAKTKNETPCGRAAMLNGRCHKHGGKSLGGVASPTFKSGRWSKFIPARLSERYSEAKDDPRLLELAEDIALLDARVADVLGRVDTGESGAIWQALQKAVADFRKATKKEDKDAAILYIFHLIERGNDDYQAWQDVRGLLDQRRRLVESERKRLVESHQMISSERAMVLIAAIVDTVRRHVTDRGALAAISTDIGKILTVDGAAGADSRSE